MVICKVSMIKTKNSIFRDGSLLHTPDSKGHILMHLIYLTIPQVLFPSKEYRPNILPNVFWFCVVMRLESSNILWRLLGEQIPGWNKDIKTRAVCLTIETSQISLMICELERRNTHFSILQRKSFSSGKNFKQCKASRLKCTYGTKLLRWPRFTARPFPLSFFPTRNKFLKNWCVVCGTFLTAPFSNISLIF